MKPDFKPSPHCLLFFIDETGHEDYADPKYPIFGMGGCAQLAGLCHRHIDLPWIEMHTKYFSNVPRPLHASAMRDLGENHVNALGDFFRHGMFARFAVMTRISTTKPDDVSMIRLVAAALLNQAAKIAGRFLFDSIGFIFEHSERTKGTIERAFSGYEMKDENGRSIRIQWFFLPKSAQEPGLEVADFVLHAAGGQVRHRLHGKEGFRKDYNTVFRGVPKAMVEFVEVEAIKYE